MPAGYKLSAKLFLPFMNFITSFILVDPEAVPQRCSYKKVLWNHAANLQENTHAEVWFQLQLYWNRTSAWVFSCKFAAYIQNTFFYEYLWRANYTKKERASWASFWIRHCILIFHYYIVC